MGIRAAVQRLASLACAAVFLATAPCVSAEPILGGSGWVRGITEEPDGTLWTGRAWSSDDGETWHVPTIADGDERAFWVASGRNGARAFATLTWSSIHLTRTTDDGASWSTVAYDGDPAENVTPIGLDWSPETRVVALLNGGEHALRILVGDELGSSWRQEPLPDGCEGGITFVPAGWMCNGRLSADGGRTWARVLDHVATLTVDRSTGTVWALGEASLDRSDDGGQSYQPVAYPDEMGCGAFTTTTMALLPHGDMVTLLRLRADRWWACASYVSVDRGLTWLRVENRPDLPIEVGDVHATRHGSLIVGTIAGLFRSADGTHFHEIGHEFPNPVPSFAFTWPVLHDVGGGSAAVGGAGLWATADTSEPLRSQMNAWKGQPIGWPSDVHVSNGFAFLIARASRPLVSEDGPALAKLDLRQQRFVGAEQLPVSTDRQLWFPDDPAATSDAGPRYIVGDCRVAHRVEAGWEWQPAFDPGCADVHPAWVDPLTGWYDARTLFRRVAVSPDDPDVLLALTYLQLLRSDDAGATWTVVASFAHSGATTLWFDPTDGRYALARNGSSLRTTDGGRTFSAISSVAPDEIAADPNDGSLIGTVRGEWLYQLARSADHGATWTASNEVLPGLTFPVILPERRPYAARASSPAASTWASRIVRLVGASVTTRTVTFGSPPPVRPMWIRATRRTARLEHRAGRRILDVRATMTWRGAPYDGAVEIWTIARGPHRLATVTPVHGELHVRLVLTRQQARTVRIRRGVELRADGRRWRVFL